MREWQRLLELIPGPQAIYLGIPVGAVVLLLADFCATRLRRQGLRAGDTRKIFHGVVFTSMVILRWFTSISTVAAASLVIVGGVGYAVWRGPRWPLFQALARPQDVPHEARYILIPLLASIAGGVIAQILAGEKALVAYLISGWGDAAGEPVGTRWGKHRYQVPAVTGLAVTRSWEGSTAVFLMSWVAALAGFGMLGEPCTGGLILRCVGIAFLASVAEAFSSHGIDNFLVPIVVALLLTNS